MAATPPAPRPRVALVTADPVVVNGEDVDAEVLLAALAADGIDVAYPRWDDGDVDWHGFDLVVMRSPWDYHQRLDEFLGWLDRVDAATTVLNPPDLIRWNLDKAYLPQLAALGVPTVPTLLCDTLAEVDAALAGEGSNAGDPSGSGEVVVKPNVSAGSKDTGWFHRRDPAARALAEHILAVGKRVLVQPAIADVAERGEVAVICFDGVPSHAIRKGPILERGGGFLGGTYTEDVAPTDPSPAEQAVAARAVEAIAAVARQAGWAGDPTPLYARLDLVGGDDDGPLLLEAELFEPSYFLPEAPGAEAAFVAALRRRLPPPVL